MQSKDTFRKAGEARNKTNLSGGLDNTKLTPAKVLTESAEERKLAGGVKDLSRTLKKSSSMPNLTWESIDNCLFSNYQSRREEHIVRNRRISCEIDNINYNDWSSGDFSEEPVTEHWRNLKNWNKESVILQHWMTHHGTMTSHCEE